MRLFPLLLWLVLPAFSRVVVFQQDGFPTVDSRPVPRAVLESSLKDMQPEFRDLDGIRNPDTLRGAAVLVLPYGSAVPADAWSAIRAYLDAGGNLVVIGGRPLWVPVHREANGFRQSQGQNAYARRVGVSTSHEAPAHERVRFAWGDEFADFEKTDVRAGRVFALGNNVRGLGYFLDARGRKTAAPVTRTDSGTSRSVWLSFEPEAGYWETPSAAALIRQAVRHASTGPTQFWVEMKNATVAPDEAPESTTHCKDGTVTLELLSGDRVVEKRSAGCNAAVSFSPQAAKGLYVIRSTHARDGATTERHFTGFYIRDREALASGARLKVFGDYFKLDGKPFVPFGANYFSTDPNRASFFTSGRNGGNAYYWERDFAEMAAHNVTFIRTGTWLNHADHLDEPRTMVSERFLRSLEAFLLAAGKSGIHVQFTFFAFDPQTIRRGGNNSVSEAWPGTNPYTDPAAVESEKIWVRTIVERFKDVPYLSWDLINEPSFSNPKRLFRGNLPSADPTETAAWNQWLEQRHGTLARLAEAWNTTPLDLDEFGKIALPAPEDLSMPRGGGGAPIRAIDYNLFAQDAFNKWVGEMIAVIRAAGGTQMVVVGQDEGGVTDRVLNQFYADAGVDFTVNHTWWRDDALLWDSVVAKRPDKPNLIGETGVQPAVRIDGTQRWDEASALGLEERKLALGFAAANCGTLHWQWAVGDGPFGVKRPDGSLRTWQYLIDDIGAFARKVSPFVGETTPPDIAMVLPQSLQLSALGKYALEAQEKCVRALFHYARADAYAVGEYQIRLLGKPKLIIVPSPWVFRQEAWDAILNRVRAGATLLVSGRIDLGEHFRTLRPEWGFSFLAAREQLFRWPGGEARVAFTGDKTTMLEQGVGGFTEKALGAGKILYSPLPLELGDNLKLLGDVYRYAIRQAGVKPAYETNIDDPGIAIAPTRLAAATLYVLTSETPANADVSFRDSASGRTITASLPAGGAALILVRHDGEIAARYDRRR